MIGGPMSEKHGVRLSQTNVLLIGILIVAAILRFNDINQPLIDATSWRQSSTAMMADNFYRRNWNIFYPEISWDGPGPSYNGREFQLVSYLAALLYTVVGQQDWVGRSVAATFGLWGVFALYQLVLRVWDQKRALASAAAMAILPGSIYIDRTFIPDPAMVALVTTGCWLLVAYYQTEERRYLWLASLASMLGFLTKITGLVVGVPMLYITFVVWRDKGWFKSRKTLILIAAAVVTLAPVIAYYFWARYLALNYPPYLFAGNDAGNWFWNSDVSQWLKQKYGLPKTFEIFRSWIWTVPFAVFVLIGLVHSSFRGLRNARSKLQSDNLRLGFWLFHWWLFGGVLYYLIGVGHLIGNPYNFHIINPPAAAFVGEGIVALALLIKRGLGKPAAIAVIMATLVLLYGYGKQKSKFMYYPSAQEGYELGLALRQVSQPSDLIATITNDIGDPIAIYYSQRRGWNFISGEHWSVETYTEDQIPNLEKLRKQGADWLGIVGAQYSKMQTSNRTFLDYIQRTCELVQKDDSWVIYRLSQKS